jgi:uncharacterized protein
MVITVNGEFVVSKKPEEVYDFLADPNRFCRLLPDFDSLEIEDEKHFTVKIKVGISYIRGTAAVKMTLAEAERPRHAVYEGRGEVPGGTASLRAGFDLSPQDGGTKVLWKGETQIGGRLPSLAGGMLEPLAKKNLEKLVDGLKAALA